MDTDCGFYSCHTVRKMSAEIDELEEQIEQLSNDNHVLKTAFIEQQEEIKSLSEENEELKKEVKLLSEKVGFWEEQTKLREAQIEEYDRLAMFDVAKTDELKEQIEK